MIFSTRVPRGACLLLMLLAGVFVMQCGSQAQEMQGKVVSVKDGDTIELLVENSPLRIRFHGVDAPEKDQPYGQKSKQFTSDQCFGKVVTVRMRDKDRYGRIVGEVILADGSSVNHALVEAGLAWWYQRYAPDDKTLQSLESEARSAKKGLWADPSPIAPWDWRQNQRNSDAAVGEKTYTVQSPDSPPASAATMRDTDTVYVTKSGKAYHLAGCEGLAHSKYPRLLRDARQTHRPCPNCGAPR